MEVALADNRKAFWKVINPVILRRVPELWERSCPGVLAAQDDARVVRYLSAFFLSPPPHLILAYAFSSILT